MSGVGQALPPLTEPHDGVPGLQRLVSALRSGQDQLVVRGLYDFVIKIYAQGCSRGSLLREYIESSPKCIELLSLLSAPDNSESAGSSGRGDASGGDSGPGSSGSGSGGGHTGANTFEVLRPCLLALAAVLEFSEPAAARALALVLVRQHTRLLVKTLATANDSSITQSVLRLFVQLARLDARCAREAAEASMAAPGSSTSASTGTGASADEDLVAAELLKAVNFGGNKIFETLGTLQKCRQVARAPGRTSKLATQAETLVLRAERKHLRLAVCPPRPASDSATASAMSDDDEGDDEGDDEADEADEADEDSDDEGDESSDDSDDEDSAGGKKSKGSRAEERKEGAPEVEDEDEDEDEVDGIQLFPLEGEGPGDRLHRLYLELVCSLLEHDATAVVQGALQVRGLCTRFLKGLAQVPHAVCLRVIQVFAARILHRRPGLSRAQLGGFFNSYVLEQLVALHSEAAAGASAGSLAIQRQVFGILHEVLVGTSAPADEAAWNQLPLPTPADFNHLDAVLEDRLQLFRNPAKLAWLRSQLQLDALAGYARQNQQQQQNRQHQPSRHGHGHNSHNNHNNRNNQNSNSNQSGQQQNKPAASSRPRRILGSESTIVAVLQQLRPQNSNADLLLVLRTLAVRPEFLAGYMANLSAGLPALQASPQLLRSVWFLCALYSLLPPPVLPPPAQQHNPDAALKRVLDCLLPPCLNRSQLLQGVQHSSPLVRYAVGSLLGMVLERLKELQPLLQPAQQQLAAAGVAQLLPEMLSVVAQVQLSDPAPDVLQLGVAQDSRALRQLLQDEAEQRRQAADAARLQQASGSGLLGDAADAQEPVKVVRSGQVLMDLDSDSDEEQEEQGSEKEDNDEDEDDAGRKRKKASGKARGSSAEAGEGREALQLLVHQCRVKLSLHASLLRLLALYKRCFPSAWLRARLSPWSFASSFGVGLRGETLQLLAEMLDSACFGRPAPSNRDWTLQQRPEPLAGAQELLAAAEADPAGPLGECLRGLALATPGTAPRTNFAVLLALLLRAERLGHTGAAAPLYALAATALRSRHREQEASGAGDDALVDAEADAEAEAEAGAAVALQLCLAAGQDAQAVLCCEARVLGLRAAHAPCEEGQACAFSAAADLQLQAYRRLVEKAAGVQGEDQDAALSVGELQSLIGDTLAALGLPSPTTVTTSTATASATPSGKKNRKATAEPLGDVASVEAFAQLIQQFGAALVRLSMAAASPRTQGKAAWRLWSQPADAFWLSPATLRLRWALRMCGLLLRRLAAGQAQAQGEAAEACQVLLRTVWRAMDSAAGVVSAAVAASAWTQLAAPEWGLVPPKLLRRWLELVQESFGQAAPSSSSTSSPFAGCWGCRLLAAEAPADSAGQRLLRQAAALARAGAPKYAQLKRWWPLLCPHRLLPGLAQEVLLPPPAAAEASVSSGKAAGARDPWQPLRALLQKQPALALSLANHAADRLDPAPLAEALAAGLEQATAADNSEAGPRLPWVVSAVAVLVSPAGTSGRTEEGEDAQAPLMSPGLFQSCLRAAQGLPQEAWAPRLLLGLVVQRLGGAGLVRDWLMSQPQQQQQQQLKSSRKASKKESAAGPAPVSAGLTEFLLPSLVQLEAPAGSAWAELKLSPEVLGLAALVPEAGPAGGLLVEGLELPAKQEHLRDSLPRWSFADYLWRERILHARACVRAASARAGDQAIQAALRHVGTALARSVQPPAGLGGLPQETPASEGWLAVAASLPRPRDPATAATLQRLYLGVLSSRGHGWGDSPGGQQGDEDTQEDSDDEGDDGDDTDGGDEGDAEAEAVEADIDELDGDAPDADEMAGAGAAVGAQGGSQSVLAWSLLDPSVDLQAADAADPFHTEVLRLCAAASSSRSAQPDAGVDGDAPEARLMAKHLGSAELWAYAWRRLLSPATGAHGQAVFLGAEELLAALRRPGGPHLDAVRALLVLLMLRRGCPLPEAAANWSAGESVIDQEILPSLRRRFAEDTAGAGAAQRSAKRPKKALPEASAGRPDDTPWELLGCSRNGYEELLALLRAAFGARCDSALDRSILFVLRLQEALGGPAVLGNSNLRFGAAAAADGASRPTSLAALEDRGWVPELLPPEELAAGACLPHFVFPFLQHWLDSGGNANLRQFAANGALECALRALLLEDAAERELALAWIASYFMELSLQAGLDPQAAAPASGEAVTGSVPGFREWPQVYGLISVVRNSLGGGLGPIAVEWLAGCLRLFLNPEMKNSALNSLRSRLTQWLLRKPGILPAELPVPLDTLLGIPKASAGAASGGPDDGSRGLAGNAPEFSLSRPPLPVLQEQALFNRLFESPPRLVGQVVEENGHLPPVPGLRPGALLTPGFPLWGLWRLVLGLRTDADRRHLEAQHAFSLCQGLVGSLVSLARVPQRGPHSGGNNSAGGSAAAGSNKLPPARPLSRDDWLRLHLGFGLLQRALLCIPDAREWLRFVHKHALLPWLRTLLLDVASGAGAALQRPQSAQLWAVLQRAASLCRTLSLCVRRLRPSCPSLATQLAALVHAASAPAPASAAKQVNDRREQLSLTPVASALLPALAAALATLPPGPGTRGAPPVQAWGFLRLCLGLARAAPSPAVIDSYTWLETLRQAQDLLPRLPLVHAGQQLPALADLLVALLERFAAPARPWEDRRRLAVLGGLLPVLRHILEPLAAAGHRLAAVREALARVGAVLLREAAASPAELQRGVDLYCQVMDLQLLIAAE